MPVEVEHIFPVIKRTGTVENSEVSMVEDGSSQALKMMDGLQLRVRSKGDVKSGELIVGNQAMPDDPERILSVTKYPNPTASSGIKMDVRNPIMFSQPEMVEVTSPLYSDRLRIQYRQNRPSPYDKPFHHPV